jgi:putative methionine-R-sulfoxide reductase with GAF domain
MLDHHLRRNLKPPLLFGATALCVAIGGGEVAAACVNPPAIGWPEGGFAPLTAQTPDRLEIQYHDQCNAEKSTYVTFRRDAPRSFFTVIKREGFNQGGWRKASQSGLTPDTAYEFEVGVVGSDNVLRKANQTFRTLKDPACQQAPLIGRPVEVVPPKPNPFEPDPGLPPMSEPAKVTHNSIEIEYHNQCPGAGWTKVTISQVGVGAITEVQEDGAGLSGWRTALARNLAPATDYKITVTALGTDNRVRKTSRTIRTSPDPSAPPKLLTAAVVLGDSFSSGEAGRWSGNGDLVQRSADPTLGGTDRAGHVDLKFIYEARSVDNLCHRSTSAPITHLRDLRFLDRVERVFNLACSGARIKHLWPLSEGGEGFRGEAPQITQLGELAGQHDIKLIVVGIGGNDMGFSDAITECITAWATKHFTLVDSASCIGALERDILPRVADVQPKLARTVALIRQEMSRRGRKDYQILLMGYPNIIPDFHGFKYVAGERRLKRCPFNGSDAQWIEDRLVPAINGMVANAARQARVSFVSLENAFDGHRLCESGTTRPVNLRFVTDQEGGWVRFVDYDARDKVAYLAKVLLWKKIFALPPIALIPSVIAELKEADQGDLQESLHPNHFGQQAVGTCLRQFWSDFGSKGRGPTSLTCRNGGSGRASDMVLRELTSPTTAMLAPGAPPNGE